MASPPNYSATPPPHAGLSLPKKRPSLAPPRTDKAKRRKPSATSLSSHPLRQTSFPPEVNESLEFSPSPSPSPSGSLASASVAGSTATGGGKRGVGRPRKNKGATDGESVAGAGERTGRGRGGGAESVARLAPSVRNAEDDDEADDEDDTGPADALLEGGAQMTEATARKEKENKAMLEAALSRAQKDQWDSRERVLLRKETVRRITNQTLSQSVPKGVVTVINSFTKVFVQELIERALDVQKEWLLAADKLANGDDNEGRAVPQRDIGPLTPNHLREALRRYKKDHEGGGVGLMGLSLEGKENTAIRNRGRRMFP